VSALDTLPVGQKKAERGVLGRIIRRPLAAFGLVVIIVTVAAALFAPWIVPFDPNEQFFDGLTLEGAPLAPNLKFWFGTDLVGRDLFSRLIYGAQTSLIIGVVANGIAVLIGSTVGICAGYFRGWVETVLMRLYRSDDGLPRFAAGHCARRYLQAEPLDRRDGDRHGQLGSDCTRALYGNPVSLGTRFHRGRARHGCGCTPHHMKHLLPHLFSTMIVWATLGIATTVLLEATLSFLGIGVQPPTASWGNIIFENQTYFTSAPWLVFIPGAAILLLALAFNLVGDALRDVLDPTQQGHH
jgi:peptide/nickel transport system permease protein